MIFSLNSTLIADITEGQHIGDAIEINNIVRDSRDVNLDSLFVALKGENFDAHTFISNLDGKIAACLVEQPQSIHSTQIVVADCKLAMGKIAAYLCQSFDGLKIALTGSCGKTTTKEMLKHIFNHSSERSAYATPGNYNNDIGLPLTVFQMPAKTQTAIFELGANAQGEIAYTRNIVQPHISILLNAGGAHLEGFGGIDGVRRAKAEIFGGDQLEKGSDVVNHKKHPNISIVNLDDDGSETWLSGINNAVFTFSLSNQNADVYAQNIHYSSDSIQATILINSPVIDNKPYELTMAVAGQHMLANALACLAVVIANKCDVQSALTALASFGGVEGRQKKILGVGGCTLIDDSYNANPFSVQAAIDTFQYFEGEKILVLGHMAELGDYAQQAHIDIGEYAKDKVDQLWVCGEFSNEYKQGFGQDCLIFDNAQSIAHALKKHSITNETTIWVKGSRSAGMEVVIIELKMNS
jgi:UDP-N-acetylmuramoyl-tripeptide--D-alanyl-D-alanine ligase